MTKRPVTVPRIPLATPQEYCDHVGIALSQAAQMRYLGTGPEFIKSAVTCGTAGTRSRHGLMSGRESPLAMIGDRS